MPKTTIIGIILWIVFIFFGNATIMDSKIKNPIAKAAISAIAFIIIGVIFTIIGFIGLVFLSPILHFFGWGWFITTSF